MLDLRRNDVTTLVAVDPQTAFEAFRDARTCGKQVLGFYHSHPDGTSAPSAYDRETVWPCKSYLIVAVAEAHVVGVRAWRGSGDGQGLTEETVD